MLSSKFSSEAYAQAHHSSNHLLKSLPQLWMTCSGARTNTQCWKLMYAQPPNKSWLPGSRPEMTRKGVPNLRTSRGPPDADKASEQSHPELPLLTPLTVSYEKLLPMIRELSDFRLPKPIKANPTKRDHNKKCAYHKEHGHTTEQCRSLHYLVERLIKAGHLK